MIVDGSTYSEEYQKQEQLLNRLEKRRASLRNFERSLAVRVLFFGNDEQAIKFPTAFTDPNFKSSMPTGFDARTGGDPVQIKNKKQSMADLKLRRLTELNLRLREDLDRPRIKVSEAAMGLITYTTQTRDFMVPQMWGNVDKREDPYAPQQSAGCGCSVM